MVDDIGQESFELAGRGSGQYRKPPLNSVSITAGNDILHVKQDGTGVLYPFDSKGYPNGEPKYLNASQAANMDVNKDKIVTGHNVGKALNGWRNSYPEAILIEAESKRVGGRRADADIDGNSKADLASLIEGVKLAGVTLASAGAHNSAGGVKSSPETGLSA